MYASVAIAGFRETYTYEIPQDISPGTFVSVPFGRSKRKGVIIGTSTQCSFQGSVKAVAEIYHHLKASDLQMKLAAWLSQYYLYDVGSYINLMVPFFEDDFSLSPQLRLREEVLLPSNAHRMREVVARLQAGEQLFAHQVPADLLRRMVQRSIIRLDTQCAQTPYVATGYSSRLSPEQQALYEHCLESKKQILLQGVTGSGKTEIYLSLMDHVLAQGRGVIYLVPEINLTPTLEKRLKELFGQRVALIHSQVSSRVKLEQYKKMQRGDITIVVGARSAIFAPVPNLGLIIVDEEHDGSYYQTETPVYHGRDVAMVRGQLEGARVILGSATPSFESYHNALNGKYELLRLDVRYQGVLPEVHLTPNPPSPHDPLSQKLHDELQAHLAAGHQAIVLLNRRGFAPYAVCTGCQQTLRCPHCDIPLTYHKAYGKLVCHSCQYACAFPLSRPHCTNAEIQLKGFGTEKLEEGLEQGFASYGVLRMDRDSAGRRSRAEALLNKFSAGSHRLLVGTQMVAKGHHFPDVELVGIVGIDNMINLPDFRCGERVFQLLMQVAGRAGRNERQRGHVYIQTDCPEFPAIQHVLNRDQDTFYRQELEERSQMGYPPYTRMALMAISGSQREVVQQSIESLAAAVATRGVQTMGPAPFLVEMTRKRYQWKLILKSPSSKTLHIALCKALEHSLPSSVHLKLYVDPVGVL
ncbi:primosomal protein N' [Desulfurispirillum indicum]|uniref:Replication restart protein PriA n=1 Tax=Desulfurispirillum indicum (strain ATCC BAA-1389 / DSM 22839 / S5) TaxID=653733 RepID=E6W149_DESIS|nr:primosomal protein N' [Desulfurispirillum indicum]ADU66469.1 primosomal protein N' [Desulfurispirillum indicum S5]UCZ55805.1 primosomal protein N' [Desulfurispirillum indicum]